MKQHSTPTAHTIWQSAVQWAQGISPLLRRRDVAHRLGISVPSLDRLRADTENGFPAAVKLSAQAQALLWHPHEIDAWLATRDRVTH